MKFFLACTLLAWAWTTNACATPLTVYIDAAGSDQNSCLSASLACLTLSRAQSVVEKINPQDVVTVSVNDDGIYWGQDLNWTYPAPATSIVGAGTVTDQTNIPVFDGCDDASLTSCPNGNRWVSSTVSNLTFQHVQVQHYANPMLLSGSHLTVENMVWEYIGNCYVSSLPESWFVVEVTNSSYDMFQNNLFEHVCTTPYALNVYVHAYYFGHSSFNTILHDAFSDVYGDTVRFRNASNNNVIISSSFDKTGEDAPVTSWFCRPWRNGACEGEQEAKECPSTGNQALFDYFDGGDTGQQIPFEANLFAAAACGVPLSQQNVSEGGIVIDYAAWPH
jgi:hypothetical protein